MRVVCVVFVAVALLGCSSDDPASSNGDDDGPAGVEIPSTPVIYSADTLAVGDTTITASGLTYIEVVPGTGERPEPGAFISVHYTGFFEDFSVFDSSFPRGVPIRFNIAQGQVIRGWDEGILLMKEGAKGRLIIPPELAYGARGSGPIPPNSTIIFDVWLVDAD